MKMTLKICLIFLSVSFTFPFCKTNRPDNTKSGEAWFIDNNTGKDTNPGTVRKPLKTIAEVNRRLQEAPASIWFAGGQVFNGNLLLNGINGTDSVPVYIGSYGKGKAMINGGEKEAIRAEDCGYLRIENIDLKGDGRKNGNISNGLSLTRCKNVTIEDIRSEGFQKSGVDLYDCRNAEIFKVVAYDNGFCGINIMGSDKRLSGSILIRDCRAENNPGDPTRLDNHSGNGILVGVSDSVVIDHCTATNNGWDMPRQGNGPVGIWAWMSDNVTIQYCISYRNRTSKGGKDGGGFDLDGGVTNSVIQYCLSYENEGAGYGLFQYPGASEWSNNIIRYCVSINDALATEGAGNFFIWNGSDDSGQLAGCYIHNNVVYSTSAPVISFENASDHENFVFSNNIFLGTGKLISGTNKGSKFLGNVWWTAGGEISFGEFASLAEWAGATGQETMNGKIAGLQSDPLLTGPFTTSITDPYQLGTLSGFKLKPGSPLKNRGVRILTVPGIDPPSVDFFGTPLPENSAAVPGIYEIEQI